MDMISCPYCSTDISLHDVEKEGGACSECGAMLPSSVLETEDDFDDEFDDEFDDDADEDDDEDDDDF